MSSVRVDIERGWTLPADQVAYQGLQIERAMSREDLRAALLDAVVTAEAPTWACGRSADAWIVSPDESVACPLVWAEGLPVVTAVLKRPAKLRPWQVPRRGTVPANEVEVCFTDHAVERYRERVRPGLEHDQVARELEAILPLCGVTTRAPTWDTGKRADAWLIFADESIACPLRRSGDMLAAATVIFRTSVGPELRRERNQRAAERRANRAYRHHGRDPVRPPRDPGPSPDDFDQAADGGLDHLAVADRPGHGRRFAPRGGGPWLADDPGEEG